MDSTHESRHVNFTLFQPWCFTETSNNPQLQNDAAIPTDVVISENRASNGIRWFTLQSRYRSVRIVQTVLCLAAF